MAIMNRTIKESSFNYPELKPIGEKMVLKSKNEIKINRELWVINIKGTSVISIEPNVANFKLGMTIKHEKIDSALAKIAVITNSVNVIFKKYKLDKNSVKIKNIHIGEDKEYDREEGKHIFKGYKAKRFYEINFTNLNVLSKFLLETNLTGANELDDL